jgi:ribosomal protein S18 acetylase RimI-like enzyme
MDPAPTSLGPACVGLRVVVRHLLPGETGPTGGPRMTDVLGVMESWSGGTTRLRTEGGVVEVPIADIVSGKPVPPKPSVRLREPLATMERRASRDWPPEESEPLGEWLLRAAGGYSRRANSALALGDPGLPMHDALRRVEEWYAARGLPALVLTVPTEPVADQVAAEGWTAFSDDVLFQVSGVAAALRVLEEQHPDASEVADRVSISDTVDESWWVADHDPPFSSHVRAVLTGPDEVALASLEVDGEVVARGRGVLNVGTDVRLGLSTLWTRPDLRGQGLGAGVLRALLEWAAEGGATSAYLQVEVGNTRAVALYERLGFLTHHSYRYLRSPNIAG